MDPAYGARYRDLYERHWWWRAREAVILDALRRHRPPGHRWSILDVGCGDGLFFDRLAELGDVEGVEPDEALVTPDGPWAPHIHRVAFDDRFAPEKRYSLVLMLDVLEHLPDPVAALRHAVTLLSPGGLLLATVPAFRSLWTRHDELNHHYTRYTRSTFRAVAERAGFAIREARYFFQWMYPAKLLVRLSEALLPPRDSLPGVPSPIVNSALLSMSCVEYATLGRLGVPVGGSLLVVAEAPRTVATS